MPTTPTELIVRGAAPEDVSVSVFEEVVLTATSPKVRALALIVNSAAGGDAPVPLRVTVLAPPPEELQEIVMVPLAAPASVGLKLT